jgi:hypothetical protein
MGKDSNIVHQYFRKEFEGVKVLVKVNPIMFKGVEITVFEDGKVDMRNMEFDQEIFDDLKEDGFETASPLEFNVYLSGLDGVLGDGGE